MCLLFREKTGYPEKKLLPIFADKKERVQI
jgi:hypothetical protein